MSAIARPGARERTGAKARTARRVTPRFWAMLGLLIGAYTACVYAVDLYKIWRLQHQISITSAQISQIQAQNDRLRAQIAQANSDVYVEQAARARLGMIKDGEIPFVVKSAPPAGNESP